MEIIVLKKDWKYCTVESHPGNKDLPLLYFFWDEEFPKNILNNYLDKGHSIIIIRPGNWNKYLTPWPAPKVFPKEEDFTGEADLFLEELTKEIIPDVESGLNISEPVKRVEWLLVFLLRVYL